MIQSKTSLEHIDTIVEQINSLIQKKEDFAAFILIVIGVEFLGSFFDPDSFYEKGLSQQRFNNGLDLFKNKRYANKKEWLYTNFRGPLIHQFWTGTEISLTSNCKGKAPLKSHFTEKNGRLIFVVEKLFEDLKEAAQSLKNLSRKRNSLNKEKLNQTYSETLEVEMDGIIIKCSGSTSQ